VVNKRSQNLHAELLLRHIGLERGRGPTFEGGAEAIADFVQEIGIEPGSVVVKDGSGLCRENRASAHSIIELLQHMDASEHARVFRESLAVSGVDPSLKGMTWIAPRGKIMAKGTLAFSGYVDGRTQRLAFSILVNDYTADSVRVRRARDCICAELTKY